MGPSPAYDLFIGTWILDPESLKYEHGKPGLRAVYTVERASRGLTFSLDADDPDGNLLKFVYGGPVDGVDREISPGVTLSLGWVDPFTIESVLKRGGKVADRWTRTVSPDDPDRMLIAQTGVTPQGNPFTNRSTYYKTS